MSERTEERRFAFCLAEDVAVCRRVSSLLCWERISRWRERLFCFSAEEVRALSESRRRFSCVMRVSRRSRRARSWVSRRCSSSDGFGGSVVDVAY